MKPGNVDLVFVLDSSASMRPCFNQLREHLKELLNPFQQDGFNVRFGLVAYAAAVESDGVIYDHTFVGRGDVFKLYGPQPEAGDFFTSDPSVVARVLGSLDAKGDEDTLLALDIAADFPFRSAETTKRVIAVFTDEQIETGARGVERLAKIPELIQKLMARRIQLFVAAPFSAALGELGSLDLAEIEAVDGGNGLVSVDFRKLLPATTNALPW